MAVEMFLFDIRIIFCRNSHSTNLKESLCKIFKGKIMVIFSTVSGKIIHQIQFRYGHKSRESCVCMFSKIQGGELYDLRM